MIALVRALPPPEAAGVDTLERLPPPEAAVHAGYLVACTDQGELDTTLDWFARLRVVRPTVGLGLISRADLCAPALAGFAHPIRPLLSPDTLVTGRVPAGVVAELRAGSVAGRLLEELVMEYGPALLAERELFEAVIAWAIRGRSLERMCRARGCHPETVRRTLGGLGLRPGRLMTRLRLRAYELMVEGGDRPAAALLACGWTDPKARQKARSRLDGP